MNINDLYWKYKKSRKTNKIINVEYPKNIKKRKIAIIIPYRNNSDNVRKNHLDHLYSHMTKILKNVEFKIFVIEQSDDGKKFNRGKLLNIGLKIAMDEKYRILITHDVDLLPQENILNYYLKKFKFPMHIAWQWKTKYTFSEYFGGIVSFNPTSVKKINGYPNDFWGWGGEDDALYNRVAHTIGKIGRPIIGDIEDITHNGPTKDTINDEKKQNILNDLKKWKTDGLNNLSYKIINKETDVNYLKLTVEI